MSTMLCYIYFVTSKKAFMKINENIVDRAINECGGSTKLAQMLGFPFSSTVTNWKIRNKIPVEYMAQIELISAGRVTRKQMCPGTWSKIWIELK